MRRSGWVWAAALAAGLWWWTSDDAASPARRPTLRAASDGPPALAVLGDKFAVSYRVDGKQVVTRVGLDGAAGTTARVDGVGEHVQLMGLAGSPYLLWVDDQDRPRTSRIGDKGSRRDDPPWESLVDHICEGGAASTDARSAAGWIDDHGNWWVLSGRSPEPKMLADAPRPPRWCRAAVQKNHTVMLFHTGHALQLFRFKEGADGVGLPRTIKHDVATRPILGFACIESGCLLATRNGTGALEASFVDARGKITWTKLVDPSPDGGSVAITSAGADRFALGYGQRAGDKVRMVAAAVSKGGDVKPVWRGADEPGTFAITPAVAWTRGRLAVARRHHGDRAEVAVDVIELK